MTHLHCFVLGAGAAQVVVHVVLEAGAAVQLLELASAAVACVPGGSAVPLLRSQGVALDCEVVDDRGPCRQRPLMSALRILSVNVRRGN